MPGDVVGELLNRRTVRGTVHADQVVVATNAYTDAAPRSCSGRSCRVLPRNRTGGDTKRALYAFRRSPDGRRVVFAGRARFGDLGERQAAAILHGFMTEVWPQMRDVRLTHGWKGFVGFKFDFLPHMGEQDGLQYAAGCQGSGVAVMSYLGHQIGLKILRRQNRPCGLDGGDFPTLPLYRGRPWFLPAVGACYKLRDRLDRTLSL